MKATKILKVGITLICSILVLTGCTTSSSHGSRSTLYENLDGLIGDSTLVALVEVHEQRSDRLEGMETTLSAVSLVERFSPRELGVTSSETAINLSAELTEDDRNFTVRQLGSHKMQQSPAPILEKGKKYLLFLTPTELPGDQLTFYVTGGDAGIYLAPDGQDDFVHQGFSEGDHLPKSIAASQLLTD